MSNITVSSFKVGRSFLAILFLILLVVHANALKGGEQESPADVDEDVEYGANEIDGDLSEEEYADDQYFRDPPNFSIADYDGEDEAEVRS